MDPFWLGVLVTLAVEGGLVFVGGAIALGFAYVAARL